MKISISHEIRFFATAKIFYQIAFAIKKNNEADKIPTNGTNHENQYRILKLVDYVFLLIAPVAWPGPADANQKKPIWHRAAVPGLFASSSFEVR